MKKIAVFAAVVAIGLVAVMVPMIRQHTPLDSLDALMEAYHDRGWRLGVSGPFNGVVLVAEGDDVAFHEAYGVADTETGAPLTTDARFLIGSASQPFTAMLVLQQVDRGTIGLDQSVAELIEWFPDDPGSELTIRRLLSHTSGLPDESGLDDIGWGHSFYAQTLTPREYAELIAQMSLLFEPGEGFAHSSFGYVLLGAVLEEVTGQSYAELLRENITEPLGLRNTGFGGNEFVATEVVPDYRYDHYGVVRTLFLAGDGTFEPAPPNDQSTAYSTGGMHSTAADLLRWTEALRSGELLSPELAQEMMRPNRWGFGYGVSRNPEHLLRQNPQAALVALGGPVSYYDSFVGMYDDGTTIILLTNVAPIDLEAVVHHTYLAAGGKELVKEPIHPSMSSLRNFDREGGVAAFVEYHRVMTQRAGYPICPDAGTLSRVVDWHIDDDRTGDALIATEYVFEDCAVLEEQLLNGTGYTFLRNDLPAEAVRIFRRNAELHPRSANVHDSLGEGLEEAGDPAEARASYARAVELAERNADPAIEVYRRNLTRLDREVTSRTTRREAT